MKTDFKNKKVLIMGLGLLGGGVASARWFVKHGAKVTVTDLKSRQELQQSIRGLGRAATKIKLALGQHRESDFRNNDYIVVNPAVPHKSKFLAIARKARKKLINDAVVFFNEVNNPVIAVTGTRGKTTTVNWIHHVLKSKYKHTLVGGNSSDKPLLFLTDILKDTETPIIVELSSWQLELLPKSRRAPDIAIITNIYPDHLNRYKGIKDYALAKANIFKYQTKKQHLIVNADNVWTKFFLQLKPKSQLWFFSQKKLPRTRNGIFVQNNKIYFQKNGKKQRIIPKPSFMQLKTLGTHNIDNLLIAILASVLNGIPFSDMQKHIFSLPTIPYREEIIKKTKKLMIVNDSAATSPDATIAALKRFSDDKKSKIILITGGTDKNLNFKEWARVVKKHIAPENLFLLNGSATKKMTQELRKINYFKKSKPQLFENLKELLFLIKNKLPITNYQLPITVLFSPSSASFEKFKNEFDRGKKFNLYSKILSTRNKNV